MATTAQIEANRQNATRSTGPTSVKGKERARINALKHGATARTIIPDLNLPLEDPQVLQDRIDRYLDYWQPHNPMETDLVQQAARLALDVERAERIELAHLRKRVCDAARERDQETKVRRLEDAQELGRRLVYISGAEEVKFDRQPLWSDDPRVLVAKLEATPEGCRWLLERWAEYRILLDQRLEWNEPTLLRFIRLMGKQVAESVYDPALNVIFLAWDVLVPKFAAEQWENFREERFRTDPSFNHRQQWRALMPRPENATEAWDVLYGIVEFSEECLKELLAKHEVWEKADDPDWADRAALDTSREFERHRRSTSAKRRELLRTLETLCKLRKADRTVAPECGVASGRWSMAPEDVVASGQWSVASEGECQMAEGEELVAADPGQPVGQDSDLVTLNHSPSDKIGILSHEDEEADAAGRVGQGEESGKTTREFQNEAKSGVTQGAMTQDPQFNSSELAGGERSQSGAGQVGVRGGESGKGHPCSGTNRCFDGGISPRRVTPET